MTTSLAKATRQGVSMLWIIVPSLIFAFLSRQVVPVVIVFIIGGALRYAQTRPEIPATYRPLLPLLQPAVVFIFLGGNPIVLAGIVFGIVMIVAKRSRLVPALEPWWRIQERMPPMRRRIFSYLAPFIIGFVIGQRAGGWEWTATLISMSVGTAVSFLLLFTPPAALRRRATEVR